VVEVIEAVGFYTAYPTLKSEEKEGNAACDVSMWNM
jgi:hypothetical protein